MNLKEKIQNLDSLNQIELIELLKFYLELVNNSFLKAEQCKNCNEGCCDVFKNNYSRIKEILYLINSKFEENIKNDIKNDIKNIINEEKIYIEEICDSVDYMANDYLVSLEFSNLEKKYL